VPGQAQMGARRRCSPQIRRRSFPRSAPVAQPDDVAAAVADRVAVGQFRKPCEIDVVVVLRLPRAWRSAAGYRRPLVQPPAPLNRNDGPSSALRSRGTVPASLCPSPWPRGLARASARPPGLSRYRARCSPTSSRWSPGCGRRPRRRDERQPSAPGNERRGMTLVQAKRRVSASGRRQPPASMALCSRWRRIAVAQGGQKRDPRPETAGIWRMGLYVIAGSDESQLTG